VLKRIKDYFFLSLSGSKADTGKTSLTKSFIVILASPFLDNLIISFDAQIAALTGLKIIVINILNPKSMPFIPTAANVP